MKVITIIKNNISKVSNISEKNLNQITEELSVDKKDADKVRNYLRLNNIKYLPNNNGFPFLYDFIKEYNENGNIDDIEYYSKMYDCSEKHVKGMFHRSNLSKRKDYVRTERSKEVIITDIDEQIIIGSILGDGHISKNENKKKNSRLTFRHSIKQKNYSLHKCNNISFSTNHRCFTIKGDELSWRNGDFIDVETCQSKSLNKYRDNWYPEGKKIIFKDDFLKIKELGIAIWFMDDGSNTTDGSVCFCTHSFSREDLLFATKHLKDVFDLEFTIHKDNVIRLRKKCVNKFKELITPYMHESMMYKISANKTP